MRIAIRVSPSPSPEASATGERFSGGTSYTSIFLPLAKRSPEESNEPGQQEQGLVQQKYG